MQEIAASVQIGRTVRLKIGLMNKEKKKNYGLGKLFLQYQT